VTVDDARRAADRVNAFVEELEATVPPRAKPQKRVRRRKPVKPPF
jgi:hypothetical protein